MGFPLLKERDIQGQYHIFSNKQFSYLTGKQYTNKNPSREKGIEEAIFQSNIIKQLTVITVNLQAQAQLHK